MILDQKNSRLSQKKKKKNSCISIVEGDLRDIFQFGKLYPKEGPWLPPAMEKEEQCWDRNSFSDTKREGPEWCLEPWETSCRRWKFDQIWQEEGRGKGVLWWSLFLPGFLSCLFLLAWEHLGGGMCLSLFTKPRSCIQGRIVWRS